MGQFLLSRIVYSIPLLGSLGLAATNMMEASIAIALFHYYRLDIRLRSVRDLLGLLLMIVFVLQPFSAIVGNVFLYFSDNAQFLHFWQNVFFWWFRNVMGQILVTPLLLIYYYYRHTIIFMYFIMTILIFSFLNTLFQYYLNIDDISLLIMVTLPLILHLVTRHIFYGVLAAVTVSVSSMLSVHYGMGVFAKSTSAIRNIIDLNFFIMCHIFIHFLSVFCFVKEKRQ